MKSGCWIVDPRDPRQNTSDVPVVTVFSAQGTMLHGKDILRLDTELGLWKRNVEFHASCGKRAEVIVGIKTYIGTAVCYFGIPSIVIS